MPPWRWGRSNDSCPGTQHSLDRRFGKSFSGPHIQFSTNSAGSYSERHLVVLSALAAECVAFGPSTLQTPCRQHGLTLFHPHPFPGHLRDTRSADDDPQAACALQIGLDLFEAKRLQVLVTPEAAQQLFALSRDREPVAGLRRMAQHAFTHKPVKGFHDRPSYFGLPIAVLRRRRLRSQTYVPVLQHGAEIFPVQYAVLLDLSVIAVEMDEKDFAEPRQVGAHHVVSGREERLQGAEGHKRVAGIRMIQNTYDNVLCGGKSRSAKPWLLVFF